MIYNVDGSGIASVFSVSGNLLDQAYDLSGNALIDGGDSESDDFIKTIIPYDTSYIINADWLANATTQRNNLLAAYMASEDAIPFFIQTDGHGRSLEGNKGCHNLAEETMGYIRNIQLGDYESYYNGGDNPSNHARQKIGVSHYLSIMGNHEFMMNNTPEADEADLSVLVSSYTPTDAVLGGQDGYYKFIDTKYNVKYLVTQPHIPDATASKGFVYGMSSYQVNWLISEMESNDGYDIVVLQHEPIGTGESAVATRDLMVARKAKSSGTYTDPNGITYNYDFTHCQNDFLCSLHGHKHEEIYYTKDTFGFPVYVADWFGRNYTCTYGLIDRDNGKLKIWKFNRESVANVLELDL